MANHAVFYSTGGRAGKHMLLGNNTLGKIGPLAGVILVGFGSSCSDPEGAESRVPKSAGAAETGDSLELGAIASRVRVLEDWRRQADDPGADGWKSEVLAAAAQGQLDLLGTHLAGAGPEAAPRLIRALLSNDEALGVLVPGPLERVYEDGTVTVERFASEPAWTKAAGGLAGAIAGVGPGPGEETGARFKFKVVRVLQGESGERFVTHQHVAISWRTGEEVVAQHARWVVHWQQRGGELPPLIERVAVGDFEQTRTKLVEGRTLFADCTGSVLGGNGSYREQLLRGLNHWLARMPYRVPMNFSGSPGLALGDVNGDGLDDLYLCQEPGLPNRLFLRNPDGT
ncbi:MAG: hypothetical protein GWO24_17090, partial [Akkermansiaceae bacterium]|nr:hypothetical protein [Akkermansiaceae bacterium]